MIFNAILDLHWPGSVPRILWVRRKCPRCTSIEFQTADSHSLDGLLRLLALSPIRCVNCWRRYYWFAKRKANKP
jgi:hypothetical protein